LSPKARSHQSDRGEIDGSVKPHEIEVQRLKREKEQERLDPECGPPS
jgi:hypothetical protein